MGDPAVAKRTGRGADMGYGKRGRGEDTEFDTESSEEGFLGRGTAEQRPRVTEKGEEGAELFVARTWKDGPRMPAFSTPTERDGDWPKATG